MKRRAFINTSSIAFSAFILNEYMPIRVLLIVSKADEEVIALSKNKNCKESTPSVFWQF